MSEPRRSGVVHARPPLLERLNAWRKRSFFSPYWLDWMHLRGSVERCAEHASGLLLDVGTAESPYAELFAPHVSRYLGLEYPPSILDKLPELWSMLDRAGRTVDVFGDGNRLPFGDGTLDTVLSTEVLEHVPRPRQCIGEMGRVLKPGGTLILTVPFLQPLHELPSDYYRYTPSSLRDLATAAGLEVVSVEPRGNFAAAVGALTVQYLLRTLGAKELQSDGSVLPSAWRNVLLAPAYATVQLTAHLLSKLSNDSAVALGYALIARKPG
ncbi:MAG: class I SAM-dependent methyltransferase [Planctomycetota bacterium]